MASTTFVDASTTIYSAWLNDVNTAVYTGAFTSITVAAGLTVGSGANITGNTLMSSNNTSLAYCANLATNMGTQLIYGSYINLGGDLRWGLASSAGTFSTGTLAYAGVIGTYSNTAMQIMTHSIARLTVSSGGNIYSAVAPATTMTDGFFYIPAAAGAPTGVPTSITGQVPMYYDSTNNNFYVYNGAWKKVTLA